MRELSSASHRPATARRDAGAVRPRSALLAVLATVVAVTVVVLGWTALRPAATGVGEVPAPISVPVPTAVPPSSSAVPSPTAPQPGPTDVVPPAPPEDDDDDDLDDDGDTDDPDDVDDDGED
jgi:hypothetical protein